MEQDWACLSFVDKRRVAFDCAEQFPGTTASFAYLRSSDTQLAILDFRYDDGRAVDLNDTGSVDEHHDSRAHNYCHGSSNDNHCPSDYHSARCDLNYAACHDNHFAGHDHGARCVSAVKFFAI